MKIAIPVDNKFMESSVCISFGRTPYFLIYDIESKNVEFLDNSAAASQGGAGIKAAQSIVDSGASVLLTPRCGENAAEVLKPSDVKIYKTNSGTAQENITDYINGKLSVLDEIHAGFHNHGGK